MRTVQAGSCLNSEQIDSLFIRVGGQEGGLGGVGGVSYWVRNPKFTLVRKIPDASCSEAAFYYFEVENEAARHPLFNHREDEKTCAICVLHSPYPCVCSCSSNPVTLARKSLCAEYPLFS